MRFFEDIGVGTVFDLGSATPDRAEIVSFGERYDPLALQRAEEALAEGDGTRLAASGWLVVGLWMRAWVEAIRTIDAELAAAGQPVARLGPALGVERLEWPHPALAGDRLVMRAEVIETRVSQSRPRWGLMRLRNGAANESGLPVLSFFSAAFVERRERD